MPPLPWQTARFNGTNNRDIIDQRRFHSPAALFGYGGRDNLVGTPYNDYINGGPGGDSLFGGHGNDTYIVDNIKDVVNDTGNDQRDSVFASVDYTLPWGVERLHLEGNARKGTGNSAKNYIWGNDLDNELRSGGGAGDFIKGGGGRDTIYGSHNNGTTFETLRGDAGNDIIYGQGGNDILWGGADHDTLRGGRGNDRLLGQAGNDILVGAGGPRVREIDTYTSGTGKDKLVLVDVSGYGDGLSYNDFGPSDYAKVTDFDLNNDVLQLKRGLSYGIAKAGRWGFRGTAITVGATDELIAVLENVSNSNAIDPSQHFQFVL